MSDDSDFLAWVTSALYDAELALHNGDPAPRRAIWSRSEPVSVLGAWRNAHGQREVDDLFATVGQSFSDCTSYTFELLAYDVVGDMAYTAGLEHTSASVDRAATHLHASSYPGVPPRRRRMAGRPPPRRHRDQMTFQ